MIESWHENVKNKNRQEIIAAAKDLFLKHNFLNVSIKDVCILAGISRVTFYKHFKSMDELIFEVQIDILKGMTQFIVHRDNSEENGEERLRKILYAWVDFAKEYKNQMKFIIFFDLYYEDYNLNEELKIKYDNFVKVDKRSFLESTIKKGIKDKSFRGDLDSLKTGYYIFQTIMGLLQRMSYTSLPNSDEAVTFDDITTAVIEMIINSIKNTESNK